MEDYAQAKKAHPAKEILRVINNSSWRVIPKSSLRLPEDVLRQVVSVQVQPVFYVEIDSDLHKNDTEYRETIDKLRWLTESDFFKAPATNGHVSHRPAENGWENGAEFEFQVEIGPR